MCAVTQSLCAKGKRKRMNDLLALYRLAEAEGIETDCFELRKRDSLSFMDEDGSCYIAIDPFRLEGEIDEKLKLAHELGHCMTGSFYNQFATVEHRQKHENQADKWAIQRLVSKDALADAVAGGNTTLWQLAEYFEVSEVFIRKAICLYTYGNLAVEQYFQR